MSLTALARNNITLFKRTKKKRTSLSNFVGNFFYIYFKSKDYKENYISTIPQLINYSEIDGEQWKQCQGLSFGAPKSLQMVTATMKLKDAYSLEEKL